MAKFYGQGATEYLVLLAVVLIIALVSIALLGFFPGMSTDTKIAQSAAYWNSAYPFAIKSHMMSSTSTLGNQLVVQNMDSTGTNTITAITINGIAANNTSTAFAPGETKTVNVALPVGSTGAVYDYPVVFTYSSAAGLTGVKQNGTKTITGKYS